jgi:hypothetical protein
MIIPEIEPTWKEISEYLPVEARRVEKKKQELEDEVSLLYFMYKLGYTNRQYDKQMLKFYRGESGEEEDNK